MTIQDPGGWTFKQLDAIDELITDLEVKVSCVNACVEHLRESQGMDCDLLHGVPRILTSALQQAIDTCEAWRKSSRERAKLKGQEVGS